MKNNNHKNHKNHKNHTKKEELPSFLLGLPKPDTLLQPSKKFIPVTYLGPLFFGDCIQLYPPPHPVNLRQEPVILHTTISEKNIFDDWFLEKQETTKKEYVAKPYRLCWNPKNTFEETPSRKCPGNLKVFKHDIICPNLDLGKSTSPLFAETSREIPICVPNSPEVATSLDQDDFEIFTLSDIRENRRIFMTGTERAAHAHYPKEFAMVRVYGPRIPESLTITSLPSKRKRISETILSDLSDQKTKVQKTEVEEAKDSLLSETTSIQTSKPPTVHFDPSNTRGSSRMDISYGADEGFEDMEGIEEQYTESMEQEM